ncbi:MAG: hypothetical protein HY747_09280 [Elusimicrobia bacterium]|nr:hypothetical protein [Elusimicrobiota bacterium]
MTFNIKEMKKIMTAAIIAGFSALFVDAAVPIDYEQARNRNELDRIINNLPEGAEIERMPTRLGLCGDAAVVTLDDNNGYQIKCGNYTFIHPPISFGIYCGETLEYKLLFSDFVDKWIDLNCDGVIEMYSSPRLKKGGQIVGSL